MEANQNEEKSLMDNHHVHIQQSPASCGISELYGYSSDPDKVLYALASHFYHPSRGNPSAIVMWSDVAGGNGSLLFTKIVDTFDKDSIWFTAPVENPKTGNLISLFIWIVPHQEFREWYKQARVVKAGKF